MANLVTMDELIGSIQYEWYNEKLGTAPHISLTLVNAPEEALGKLKSVFERSFEHIGARQFIDALDLYEFDKRECPKGLPIKVYFLSASFSDKIPQGSSLETMRAMSQMVAKHMKRQLL